MTDYLDNNIRGTENDGSGSFANDDIDLLLTSDNELDFSTCAIGVTRISRDPQRNKANHQLIMATIICFIFMIAELIGGYVAGSLAIMADAAHLLTDCISFIVALLAIWLSQKPPDKVMTFGYKRAEVLGAIISILGIWLLTTFLCYLAFKRLINNNFDINADTMMIVSGISVGINVIMGFILHGSCNILHTHSHSGREKLLNESNDYKPLVNENQLLHENDFTNVNNNVTQPSFVINDSNSSARFNNESNSKTMNGTTHGICVNNSSTIHNRSSTRLSIDSRQFSMEENQTNQILQSIYAHKDSTNSIHSMENAHNHSHDFANKNINIQAAVIHVLGDFIQSIGVFIAAIIIKFYPSAKIADPLCTFVFSIIVIFTTVSIMKESVMVILDAVPRSIDLNRLTEALCCIEGVKSVHFLNVWSVSVHWNIMSAHLIIEPNSNSKEILAAASLIAKRGFDIKHSTIQLEHFIETY